MAGATSVTIRAASFDPPRFERHYSVHLHGRITYDAFQGAPRWEFPLPHFCQALVDHLDRAYLTLSQLPNSAVAWISFLGMLLLAAVIVPVLLELFHFIGVFEALGPLGSLFLAFAIFLPCMMLVIMSFMKLIRSIRAAVRVFLFWRQYAHHPCLASRECEGHL